MNLAKEQLEQLYHAFIAAFDRAELIMMLRFKLGVSAEQMIPEHITHPEAVLRLIDWAEREGRTIDLLRGACLMKPGNTQLHIVCTEFLQILTLAGVATPPPAIEDRAGSGATMHQLDRAQSHNFDLSEVLSECIPYLRKKTGLIGLVLRCNSPALLRKFCMRVKRELYADPQKHSRVIIQEPIPVNPQDNASLAGRALADLGLGCRRCKAL